MRNYGYSLLISSFAAMLVPDVQAATSICDQCVVPGVSLYDTKVSADQASGSLADSLSTSLNFRDAAMSVRTFVDSLDPNRDCMHILAGEFSSRTDSADYRVRGGIGYANTVAKGAVGLMDYMLHSEIGGKPGSYSVTISLETSKTRESVAAATRSFASASDVAKATDSAVASLGSVFTKIRTFEKKKRTTGHPFALSPIIRFAPVKPKIEVKASTVVEITMMDCDGVALANRTLSLSTDGGSFAPASVTTDASGKAQSTFTAGNTAMAALLVADYSYTTPAGVAAQALTNQGVVTIGDAQDEIWQLTGTYRGWNTNEQRTDTKMGELTEHILVESGNRVTVQMTALLYNIASRTGVTGPGVKFWSEPMKTKFRISASGSDWERSNRSMVTTSGWTSGFDHSLSTGRYAPDSSEEIESLDFHFVEDTTGGNKGARYLSVGGIRLAYKGAGYVQAKNSVTGITKSENTSSDGSGAVEFTISYATTDAGYSKDTSYTENNSKIREHHEESVTRLGVQYLFSSRYDTYERIQLSSAPMEITEVQRHFHSFVGSMVPLWLLPPEHNSVKPIRATGAAPALLSVALGKRSNIRFSLPTAARASFQIVNPAGQILASIPEADYAAGVQSIQPDLSAVGSGVCYLSLRVHALDGSGDTRLTRSVPGVR